MHDVDPQSVAFLTRLQEDLLGPEGRRDESIELESARLVFAGIPEDQQASARDAFRFPDGALPTPYENADSYAILSELTTLIVAALAEDRRLEDLPLVGTLPLGRPKALLLRVPDSAKHVVVVDSGATVFANLLAKACAQGLLPGPDGSEDSWIAALAAPGHPGVLRYIELVTATLGSGPAAAPQYWPGAEWTELMIQLRTAIETFVVAEPLVHLALGNTATAERLPVPTVHPDAESYLWSEAQRVETFVMRIGVTAAVLETKGFDKPLGYWGIEMFLMTLVLIEHLQATRFGLEPPSNTYAVQELGWLQQVLEHAEGPESRSLAVMDRLQPVAEAFVGRAHLALGPLTGRVQ